MEFVFIRSTRGWPRCHVARNRVGDVLLHFVIWGPVIRSVVDTIVIVVADVGADRGSAAFCGGGISGSTNRAHSAGQILSRVPSHAAIVAVKILLNNANHLNIGTRCHILHQFTHYCNFVLFYVQIGFGTHKAISPF